jgi:hypothetical protein
MCGGKKKSAPPPQVLPALPAKPGYVMDQNGVIRDGVGAGTAVPSAATTQPQSASFGSELGTTGGTP